MHEEQDGRLTPTGVPGLDVVLGGGLPIGALSVVVGAPGSGKTTLAAQAAFAAARRGHRALILTAASEPADKLLAHLSDFAFFDAALIGETIHVFSLQSLVFQGLEALADEVQRLTRELGVRLVVLDGFSALRSIVDDERPGQSFLYEVGTALGVLGVTTIMANQVLPVAGAFFPEAMIADLLIALHYEVRGEREVRRIEAVKVRGRPRLAGRHGLTLTERGITVYPRLEARVMGYTHDHHEQEDEQDAPPEEREPVPFGLAELDRLVAGGLTRETATVIAGSPGAGKTLLGLHWALAGVEAGDSVVYLSFRETRRQLLQAADVFALGPRLRAALAPGGGLQLLRMTPVECDPDVIADGLLAALDQTHATRLVIDSLTELEAVIGEEDPPRLVAYLTALIEALRRRGVTSLVIKETQDLVTTVLHIAADAITTLVENVLLVQQVTYGGRLYRVLSVLKMRFAPPDQTLREFRIAPPPGIVVLTPMEADTEALAGIARQQGGQVTGAEEAQRGGRARPVPAIVVMTAFMGPTLADIEANVVLPKPFNIERIEALLAELVPL